MKLTYFILTNGRAGSTLLNTYLTQLGVGEPQAWLATKFFSDPYTLADVHRFLESRRVDGILGVKLSWWYIFQVCDTLDIDIQTLLSPYLLDAKYIYLSRRDKVHQALSRVKHDLLKRHHVQSEASLSAYREEEQALADREPPLGAIRKQMLVNSIAHLGWEHFFREFSIEPYRLMYEDFVANKAKTCRELLSFLGVDVPNVALVDTFLSTHSELNTRWHAAVVPRAVEIL